MKTIIKALAAFSAITLSVVSCNKEFAPQEKGLTHKVSFIAEQSSTKTTAAVDGSTVNYSWTEEDGNRFTVYEVVGETYTAATETVGVLDGGVMTLMAEFSGSASADAKYQAVFNSGVKASQNCSDTGYDQDSDVLVSEQVSASGADTGALSLRFKRLVAINKVTLKGLEEGALLGSVVIESVGEGQELVGTYSVKDCAFTDKSSSLCIADVLSEVSGSSASTYFVTLPVDAATLKLTAVTVDEKFNFAAAYEKTLSKTVDFKRGDLTSFGLSLNAKTEETFDLTVVGDVQASEDQISWDRTLVSIIGDKDNATTKCNNYYPGVDSRTSTRFYTGSTLTITPKCGVEIGKIVFTATTENYAKALAESTWTNATASYTGKIVTVTPTDCAKPVSAKIGATTGHEKIVVTFGEVAPISVTGVSLDKSELSLSEGDKATLTATVTPADATNQNVTWTSDNTAVATVSDAGLVTAVAVGTATITVTTEDGAHTATCAVTVTESSGVETKVLIIDGSQLTSSATSKDSTSTYSGIDIVFSKGAKQQSSSGDNKFTDTAILIGKSGAYIYNKTAIPGKIVKFEIYANKGASTKVSVGVNFSSTAISNYSGSAANTYTATLSTQDKVYDCTDKLPEGAQYFWYQVTNKYNSQVQFRITYEE